MSAAVTLPGKLPAEALAIIQQGTPKPLNQAAAVAPTPEVKPAEVRVVPSEPVATAKPKPVREAKVETVAYVSLTARVPAEIQSALLKASSERKIRKVRPYSQQDIITEALKSWLQKNGHLD